jgi:hypothetical protein
MLVKRKRKDAVKDQPFGLSGIVGMKVAVEEKSMRGWKLPPTVDENLKSGKVPLGKEKGYHKGKDTEEKE